LQKESVCIFYVATLAAQIDPQRRKFGGFRERLRNSPKESRKRFHEKGGPL